MPCIIFLPKKAISFFYVSTYDPKKWQQQVYFFVWQQGVYFTVPVCFYQKIAKTCFYYVFTKK